MPDHRGFAVDEIVWHVCPEQNVGGHDLALVAEIGEILQRGDNGRIVERDLVRGFANDIGAVADHERLEEPVGNTIGRNFNAPLTAIGFGQLFRGIDHFLVGRRWLGWIETGGFEQILVVVQNGDRALERQTPNVTLIARVGEVGGVEIGRERIAARGFNQVVEWHDRVGIDERVEIGREQNGDIGWRAAALDRRLNLGQRVGITARENGVDFDVRIRGLEFLNVSVDHLGDRTGNRDRIVERECHGRGGG